jgi:hypothetical protein
MYDDASAARKWMTRATFGPARATDGDLAGQLRHHLLGGMSAVISVVIRPGVTVLTVIPIPLSVFLPDFANW